MGLDLYDQRPLIGFDHKETYCYTIVYYYFLCTVSITIRLSACFLVNAEAATQTSR